MDTDLEAELFELLQRKAVGELDAWVASNIQDTAAGELVDCTAIPGGQC